MRKIVSSIIFTFLFGMTSNCFAVDQLLKTVCPSGCDHATLQAAVSGNAQDLVANNKYLDIEISGSWSSNDTTVVNITGYTTDATHYINIYGTGTARFVGDAAQANIYQLVVNDGFSSALNINESNVTIDGLYIENTNSTQDFGANACYAGDFNNITIKNSLCKAAGDKGIYMQQFSGTNYVINSVGIATGNDNAICAGYFGGTQNNLNSIGIGNSGPAFGACSVAVPVVKNCYGYSASNVSFGPDMTITTSASDDGSESTATVAYSTSAGTYFTNITGGSENFHIGSSSELKNVGTDLSGTFTYDVDSETRPTGASTWDMGIDEIVTVTPTANFKITGGTVTISGGNVKIF